MTESNPEDLYLVEVQLPSSGEWIAISKHDNYDSASAFGWACVNPLPWRLRPTSYPPLDSNDSIRKDEARAKAPSVGPRS